MTPDATASEEKGGRSYWGFVIWPVAAVMVYVLSEGPAAMGVWKGVISRNTISIYKPLDAFIHITGLEGPYVRYLQQWCPGAFFYKGELGVVIVDI